MADEVHKHAGGRPRKYNSPEEMQRAIDKYFADNPKPTICGLTLELGFDERHALLNYEGYSKEFYSIIKNAKTRVEKSYEEGLRGQCKPTGPIFALKQFGWKDDRGLNLGGQGDNPINITVTVKNAKP